MNDCYRATKTRPGGAVGDEWPELGWLLPTPPQSGAPPTHALEAGVEVTLLVPFTRSKAHPVFDIDHFVRTMERTGDGSLSITLDGGEPAPQVRASFARSGASSA